MQAWMYVMLQVTLALVRLLWVTQTILYALIPLMTWALAPLCAVDVVQGHATRVLCVQPILKTQMVAAQ